MRYETRFRRPLARRVPFSRFELRDAFSASPSASGPVFTFCSPGRAFGVPERVGFGFHVLRSGTRFRRHPARRVPFSRFALRDAFSALPSSSGPVSTFCAPGCVFGVSERVGSGFHVLRYGTHFRRRRARRVPFSRFALRDAFSASRSASCPVFTSCAPGRIVGVPERVGSRFHVLRSGTRFRPHRARRVPFRVAGRFFGVSELVGSCFHVLCSGMNFRRHRTRRVPFSGFALRDTFSESPCASGPVFTFSAPGRIFGVNERVGSRFHVLRSGTCFRRHRARRVQFSRFALREAFSA